VLRRPVETAASNKTLTNVRFEGKSRHNTYYARADIRNSAIIHS